MMNLPNDCELIINDDDFKKKIIIYKGFWNTDVCRKYNDYLFIYGDNDANFGEGGQAIIRKCYNALGIPTKKYPNNNPLSFYTDDNYESNCKKIKRAVINIIRISSKFNYRGIVFPEKGFGTGLAKLNIYAPKTLRYLNTIIQYCFGIKF